MDVPAGRTPFIVLCGNASCGWRWPAAYLPMPMSLAADLMKAARCPMCGSRNERGEKTPVLVGSQS